MAFTDLVTEAQIYFPNLQVKYKSQSTLMKVLGKVLFFDPDFMTSYLTTLGDTVYIPDNYVANSPEAACDVFIHECTHMYDEKRLGFWYQLAYAFPQLLSPLMLLLLFVLSWKIVIPLVLLFLLPLPAPFRTYFEKRAYCVQMYAGQQLWGDDPTQDVNGFNDYFTSADYYYMWPFGQTAVFTQEAANVAAGKPSCMSEPALFQQVTALIAAAKK